VSNLYIAITSADDDPTIQARALVALEAAGIEVYRSWIQEPPSMGPPNRDHMIGQRVKVVLHKWASKHQPTEGLYLGHGERGFGIIVEGGGRYQFVHSEVRSVELID
jgi:hypothetical protein